MSLATLPTVVLDTIITRLAVLFLTGAGGDMAIARDAAEQMLLSYRPDTPDELRVAANIMIFSFQGLESLSQAAVPGIRFDEAVRLRNCGASLNRESAKAERRLDLLQKTRQRPIPNKAAGTDGGVRGQSAQPDPQPHAMNQPMQPSPAATGNQPEPTVVKPVADAKTPGPVAMAAKARNLTWSQAYEQRQTDARIAASLKRAEARIAAMGEVERNAARASDPVRTASI